MKRNQSSRIRQNSESRASEFWRIQLLLAFALFCAAISGCAEAKPAASVPLAVKTWQETEALIASHKGKVVVVDLWSTWCQPCMEEFPGLVKLHQQHADKVACISVNLNYSGAKGEKPEDARDDVLKFLTKQQAHFDNILCGDEDSDVYKALNLAAVPAVLVYDKTGRLRKRFDNESNAYGDAGFKYEAHVAPLVEKLLSE